MRISSENFFLSKPLPRFMCDVMLARLARYLRAASYDTALAADAAPDRDIIRQTAEEGRWLLTMDRKIQDHKAARGRLVVLAHAELDAQARELQDHFVMDWAGHAFFRCILDNTLLEVLKEVDIGRVPDDVRLSGQPLMRCPSCGRVYWHGSHYRRMMGRLLRWQGGDFA